MTDDDPVVVFLVRFGLVERLQRVHVDDGTGHCTTCSAGGQVGRDVWPCQLACYLERAAGLRARGRRRNVG